MWKSRASAVMLEMGGERGGAMHWRCLAHNACIDRDTQILIMAGRNY